MEAQVILGPLAETHTAQLVLMPDDQVLSLASESAQCTATEHVLTREPGCDG